MSPDSRLVGIDIGGGGMGGGFGICSAEYPDLTRRPRLTVTLTDPTPVRSPAPSFSVAGMRITVSGDRLIYSVADGGPVRIELFDSRGRTLAEGRGAGAGDHVVNLSVLGRGVYYAEIRTATACVRRLIVH